MLEFQQNNRIGRIKYQPLVQSTRLMKAFLGITGITSVIVPLSGRILNLDCFKDCTNLTTITLSPSTNYIGSRCFQGCTSLTTIRVYNPTPAIIYHNSFPDSCNFYIPENYITNYTNDSTWSEFGERLKQGHGTRYYYKYNGLRGVIKEYTSYTLGFSGISVSWRSSRFVTTTGDSASPGIGGTAASEPVHTRMRAAS